ncbi:GntR family transcriptional regulator [Planktotalea sp.]|uniref:GntR family transcriptional regulator n=1 Tax=Planktotalea sp. TaxID=2029877 RepID=UPI003D6ADD6B
MTNDTDIFAQLQRRLISNGFEHGAKLRAEVLRKEFACSASTVREALFRLSTLGLVDFQEQRGFRVPVMSPEKLIELTHLRILLESEGTVLSIRKGGVAWEARLAAAHYKLSHIEKRIHGADDLTDLVDIWFSAEKEFHETLISACGSATLKQIHGQIYAQFRQQLMKVDRKFDFISENIQHHADILDAALAGDEALTHTRIHDHLARHLTGTTLDAYLAV